MLPLTSEQYGKVIQFRNEFLAFRLTRPYNISKENREIIYSIVQENTKMRVDRNCGNCTHRAMYNMCNAFFDYETKNNGIR